MTLIRIAAKHVLPGDAMNYVPYPRSFDRVESVNIEGDRVKIKFTSVTEHYTVKQLEEGVIVWR